jgi:hypothetical protein
MVLSAINRGIKGIGEHFPGLRGMLSEMYCLALSGFTGCAYVGRWYVQGFFCAFSGFTGYACGLVFMQHFPGLRKIDTPALSGFTGCA